MTSAGQLKVGARFDGRTIRDIVVDLHRPSVSRLFIGQFDHWATPYAKDFDAPSMNALVPMLLDLTDATGSAADLVRVKVTKLRSAA